MDFLTAKQVVLSGNYDYLYVFMHGRMFENVILDANYNKETRPAEIIKLEKKSVELDRAGLGFFYTYGWPGPDYDYYLYSDFGYSWAFSKDELLHAQKTEWEKWQRGTCLSTEETRAIMDAVQFIQATNAGKPCEIGQHTVETLMHILEKTTHKLI